MELNPRPIWTPEENTGKSPDLETVYNELNLARQAAATLFFCLAQPENIETETIITALKNSAALKDLVTYNGEQLSKTELQLMAALYKNQTCKTQDFLCQLEGEKQRVVDIGTRRVQLAKLYKKLGINSDEETGHTLQRLQRQRLCELTKQALLEYFFRPSDTAEEKEENIPESKVLLFNEIGNFLDLERELVNLDGRNRVQLTPAQAIDLKNMIFLKFKTQKEMVDFSNSNAYNTPNRVTISVMLKGNSVYVESVLNLIQFLKLRPSDTTKSSGYLSYTKEKVLLFNEIGNFLDLERELVNLDGRNRVQLTPAQAIDLEKIICTEFQTKQKMVDFAKSNAYNTPNRVTISVMLKGNSVYVESVLNLIQFLKQRQRIEPNEITK